MKKAFIEIDGKVEFFGGIIEISEYDLMKDHELNRNLDNIRLEDLRRRATPIEDRKYQEEYPFEEAIVLRENEDGTFTIISGHHRTFVCEELRTEIKFTLTKNNNPRVCDDTWKSKDRRDSKIKEGNKSFIEAEECSKEYGIGYGGIYTAFKGQVGSSVGRKGKGENFEINDEENIIGYKILNEFKLMNEITHFNYEDTKKNIIKVLRDIETTPNLKEQFDFTIFLSQCKKNKDVLVDYRLIKNIIGAKKFIKEIYNKRLHYTNEEFSWK